MELRDIFNTNICHKYENTNEIKSINIKKISHKEYSGLILMLIILKILL